MSEYPLTSEERRADIIKLLNEFFERYNRGELHTFVGLTLVREGDLQLEIRRPEARTSDGNVRHAGGLDIDLVVQAPYVDLTKVTIYVIAVGLANPRAGQILGDTDLMSSNYSSARWRARFGNEVFSMKVEHLLLVAEDMRPATAG